MAQPTEATLAVDDGTLDRAAVLHLQRHVGNQVVAELLGHAHSAAGRSPAGVLARPTLQRVGGWTGSKGINAGERTDFGIRRIPIDGIDLAQGNQEVDRPQGLPTGESAANRAIVLISRGLDASKPVEVLFYLHGHNVGFREESGGTVRDLDAKRDRLEEQLSAVGDPQMVAVLPQGTHVSGFGKFDPQPYLDAVFARLGALDAFGPGIKPPSRKGIVLTGHSGAGDQLSALLTKDTATAASQFDAVELFDAINGPIELGRVKGFVTKRVTFDVASLQGNQDPDKFLSTSFRFRAFFGRGGFYDVGDPEKGFPHPHKQLQDHIDKLFSRTGPAGALPSAVSAKLKENYKVIPVAGAGHDQMVGRNLEKALKGLPGVTPGSGPVPVTPGSGPVPVTPGGGTPGGGPHPLLGFLIPIPDRPRLSAGSRGSQVVLLQSELNALDDRIQLALDGVFGQQTRRAVLAFQRDHGLRGDGIVGPRTWEALDTSVASLASPVASR